VIISHRHKFIFFATPKTATHAIREALRQHLGPDDWEQQVLFGKQALPIPEIAALRHGHIGAREIRSHLDPAIWRDYFKFGFVRNPYDRFVSVCFFLNRSDPNFAEDALTFMRERIIRKRFQDRVLVRPQHKQLCDDDGEIALDFVGRYENLQQSYDEICKNIGISSVELTRKNSSEHSKFVDYYQDEDLRRQVAEFYAEDLRLFAYEFPGG
jgi:hypothetical protein